MLCNRTNFLISDAATTRNAKRLVKFRVVVLNLQSEPLLAAHIHEDSSSKNKTSATLHNGSDNVCARRPRARNSDDDCRVPMRNLAGWLVRDCLASFRCCS